MGRNRLAGPGAKRTGGKVQRGKFGPGQGKGDDSLKIHFKRPFNPAGEEEK